MKHLKTYERYQGRFGKADIIAKNDFFLINVVLTNQKENVEASMNIRLKKGDKIENVEVDYVDDTERISDISGFSLNELLQIDNNNITKIEAIDYSSYIPQSNVDVFYNTNEKNGSVTSVSYDDIQIIERD